MKNQYIKVLIIGTLGYNGIASVIMNYYTSIDKKFFKFNFLVSDSSIRDEYKELINENNSKIVHFTKRRILRYFLGLHKELKEGRYDIIHIHCNSATVVPELIIAKLHKVKTITHIHNTTNKYRKTHLILRGLMNKLANVKVACSEVAGEWGYGKGQFQVINNGINISMFNVKKNKKFMIEQMGFQNFDKIYLHVGTFTDQKNHHYLLKVFNEIHSVQDNALLICVGDGPLKDTTVELAKTLGIINNVIFTGNINNVNDYYSISDYLIMPSKYEGLPVVLIEAQFAGLRIYASDIITKECVISNQICYLKLEDSPKTWAKVILEQQKNSFETNLLDVSRKFDMNNNVDKLSSIYSELI